MLAVKATKRKAKRKVTQVKEKQAVYAVPIAQAKKAVSVQETHMEFHIVLPKEVDVDQFTDRLIEVVEAYEGSIGGGIVKSGK